MSVVANVAINVDSRNAASKIREFTSSTTRLDATVKSLDGRLRDASGRFVKAGEAAQASSRKVSLLGNAIANLSSQLAVAEAARRYFKGFNEAEKAAAAVRTLGVDSKVLEQRLLGVSNSLGGLYSQTQLLAASYDVASAGFANAADNAKILEASAKGATGGLSDINTVGNAVTSVLNAYGKSANDAAILVDGFIQTQNDGKIVLNEYAGFIGRLAPTAAAAGIGIQELNAAVSTITAQGVPVEATFTGLNQALVSILKPSAEATELAKSLGIDFNEAGLRAKGFGGLLEDVKTKTGGSTTALVKLFGSVDALKAVLPLVNDDLVKYNQNLDRQGKASGIADKATKDLGGTVSSEITKMINQIGNLVRALDTVLGPALGGVVRGINAIIAQATLGIQTLAQLFSMDKNTSILKGALESGNLRGSSAPRVIQGVDELIGQERRVALQKQAGAGSGFLGLGLNAKTFAELLKKEPAIQRLLGTNAATNKSNTAIDPALQALLDSLLNGSNTSSGGSSAGRAGGGADQAAQEAARALEVQKQQLKAADDQNFALKNRFAILQETEAVAKRELELDVRLNEIAREYGELKENVKSNDELILINANSILEKKAAELEAEREINDLIAERVRLMAQLTQEAMQPTVYNELETQDAALQAILDKYPAIGAAADAAATMATSGIQAMIAGTKSAEQVFVEFLSSIADALIDTAKQMIAQYIALGIARMFAMGSQAGNFAPSGPLAAVGNVNTDVGSFFTGFAEGGFVTGPTRAVVGEGGEPEYIIPASKMSAAMKRYGGGARGSSVIPTSGDTSEAGGNSAPVNGAIDVRYTVERINSVDYVTADQFQQGMQQAAMQGAQRGEQMVLRKLQQSPSTRRRVGVS